MGYMLNSLGNLPTDPHVSLYIFVVNGGWKGGPHEVIERNFTEIARQIGASAVIAKGLSENWTEDIASKYFGSDHSHLTRALPALFLTNAHPDRIDENTMRLIVPLQLIEARFGNWDSFFHALTEYALNRNDGFLKRFEDAKDYVGLGNDILDLKPNMFGIGININAIVDRVRRRKPRRSG